MVVYSICPYMGVCTKDNHMNTNQMTERGQALFIVVMVLFFGAIILFFAWNMANGGGVDADSAIRTLNSGVQTVCDTASQLCANQ